MSHEHKLSLPLAILININIMLGAGIFLNTTLVAQQAQALGFMSYVIVGILLLPLVLSIAQLVAIHPSGGFYTFGKKEINTFVGFISAWSYFAAKLASAAILIHSSVITIQLLIPFFAIVDPFFLDFCIISLFVAGNMFNIKTGGIIQTVFIVCKLIPILFTILAGMFLFSGANYGTPHLPWSGVPSSLPLVIYATMGFESACSISSKIKNAHKNAPLAILISYTIAVFLMVLYQVFCYGALGATVAAQTSYRETLPRLLGLLLRSNPLTAYKVGGLLNLAIASSALGGSYGVLFSNSWNLYTLAEHGHLFLSSCFKKLNKHAIPFVCVLAEGALCVFYLLISQGPNQQKTLQILSALGVISAYTISVIALICAKKRDASIPLYSWIPLLGLINCGVLMSMCIKQLVFSGLTALLYFFCLILTGALMFFYTQYQNKNSV